MEFMFLYLNAYVARKLGSDKLPPGFFTVADIHSVAACDYPIRK